MARPRDERGSSTRYRDGGDYMDDRERRHRHSSSRHKDRGYDDEPSAATRERRERRRAEEARREADMDINELRARRESYYTSRPESRRERESTKREPVKDKSSRSSKDKEVRRDSSKRTKKRDVVADDRDDFVYGKSKSRGRIAEEVPVRRPSTRKRSEEGGSSSRTAYTPLSGSGSASVRRVEIPPVTRTTSIRETREARETREPRESSKAHASARPSVRRTGTIKPPTQPPPLTRTQSVKEAARRSTGGILSSFFKPSTSRTPSAGTHKEERRVDCLVCMNDDLPLNKTVKLACGHRMCYSCLKRQFSLSVKDPAHMPPRCCTSEHIPLKYADRLFDDKFKTLWNKKFQEYTTANRLYCPSKGCGQWVKPSKIKMDPTYGRNKFHTKRECPKDEETNRVVEMAKEQGWQRCYSCKAVVELKEGCNHMTCRCTAQFCMVCAAPWKTCSCPWFNYEHIPDDDRLNDMRVPQPRYPDIEVVEIAEEPPLARRPSTRARERVERDREFDRGERVMSAHLRDSLHVRNPTPAISESRRTEPDIRLYALGNAGAHHMNESYAIRSMPTSAARTAARISTPRTSTPRTSTPRASFFSSSSSRRVAAPVAAPVPMRSAPVAAPVPMRSAPSPVVTSSTMAGLSKDGRKIGANRVGTWLSHVQIDPEATTTAARDVEVDDWRCDGTMIGID
ncbi:hypothetical protein PTMSG1_09944 [Pyrenophora teres f. maculata]|nr:hypothetical protein PTMSG1_09944 [Pyrenophora teres f. maculata]